ncbi:MAG: hypothetical protein NT011_03705 [Kiritimatiellaeota bacterium]|nr:hypothetical protein [Kiritimatiellota bacterium]
MNNANQRVVFGKWGKTEVWYLAIILIYFALNMIAVLHHEPWRDESNPWLISRDANIVEMFKLRPYSGHPALWNLILFPFAQLGFPYITQGLIHLGIATASIALFVCRAPFSLITKILFTFSYYMFWQYAIEIRLYAAGVLLLFLIANLYPRRYDKSFLYSGLVILLFNTSMHLFPLACGITMAFAGEAILTKQVKLKTCAAFLLMVVMGALFACLQAGIFFAPQDLATPRTHMNINIQEGLKTIVGAFYVGAGPVAILAPAAITTLLLVFCYLLNKPAVLLVSLCHIFGFLALLTMYSPGTLRHYGLILIGVFYCLWIASYQLREACQWPELIQKRMQFAALCRAPLLTVLNVCLLISMPYGIIMHYYDYKFNYSGCKEMAEFIKANHYDQYPIAAHRYAHLSSIAPYLPGKQFWNAGLQQFCTYYSESQAHFSGHGIPYDEALKRMDETFPLSSPLLVLLNAPLGPEYSGKYIPLYKVDSTVFGSDEPFYLYLRKQPTMR